MQATLDPRSFTIATFALCGFANFSSIGIQIGGIGALAPNKLRLARRDHAPMRSACCAAVFGPEVPAVILSGVKESPFGFAVACRVIPSHSGRSVFGLITYIL
jgi:hypothetical protein